MEQRESGTRAIVEKESQERIIHRDR